jgi:DNA primase
VSKFSVRCIFHEEKTPSLMIDTKAGRYHCFSCSKEGELERILEDYSKDLINENSSNVDINLRVKNIKRIANGFVNRKD